MGARYTTTASYMLAFVLLAAGCTPALAEPITLNVGMTMSQVLAIRPQSTEGIRGEMAAFTECNMTDCARGIMFNFIALDDNYTRNGVLNYTGPTLINDLSCIAILGPMGTTPTVAMIDYAASINVTMPIIGSPAGGTVLRDPFKRNVINLRAGYGDETAAMVNWLTGGSRYYTRISAFYQNDPGFGRAALAGLQSALAAQGLSVYSSGSYQPNSVDVAAGFESIFTNVTDPSNAPQVVCIFSLGAAAVKFMNMTRYDPRVRPDTIYLVISIVGGEEFYKSLVANDIEWSNIYATQAFPSPYDNTSKVVQRYQKAMDYLYPGGNYTYFSLEGYINGRFLSYALTRAGTNLTRESLLTAIYETKKFVIDDMEFGPFIDTGASRCNQGSKTVWMSKLERDGRWINVPEGFFQWSGTCLSSTANLLSPIILGQSADFSGPNAKRSTHYKDGLFAALNKFNRLGGRDLRVVKVVSLDDAGDSAIAKTNTANLLKLRPIALVGYSEPAAAIDAFATARMATPTPFIAPMTGVTDGLRAPCSKYSINVRPSYSDEAAAMVNYAWSTKEFRRIAVFYQDDAVGISGRNATKSALTLLSSDYVVAVSHAHGENATGASITRIADNTPDAILVFSESVVATDFINKALANAALNKAAFFVSSAASDFYLMANLSPAAKVMLANPGKLHLMHFVPNAEDVTFPVVQEYQAELSLNPGLTGPSRDGLEGYIAGRFITRALSFVSGNISAEALANVFYQFPVYDINGYRVGPFELGGNFSISSGRTDMSGITQCSCNQGAHQVYVTELTYNSATTQFTEAEVNAADFAFETCGVVFLVEQMQEVSEALRGVITAASVLCLIVCVVFFIGVIVYRDTKTMTNSSPIFLCIVLVGAMFLSLSAWFTVPWGKAGVFYTVDEIASNNKICMSWIWLLGIGFVLFFSPLVAKTYRVHRIFNNRVLSRIIIIKNSELVAMVGGLLVLELVLLIVWTAVSHQQFQKIRIPGTVDGAIYFCSGTHDTIFAAVQGAYFGAIALAGLVFAFLTRNIKYGSFKESHEIVLCVYTLTFVSIVLVPIGASLWFSPAAYAIIRALGVLFVVLTSVVVLFGMKFYRIITHSEKLSTTANTRPGSTMSNSINTMMTGSTSGRSTTTGSSATTTSSTTTTTDDEEVDKKKANAKKPAKPAPSKKGKGNGKDEESDDEEEMSSSSSSSSSDSEETPKAKPTKKVESQKPKSSSKDTPIDAKSPESSSKSPEAVKKPAPAEESDETEPSTVEEKPKRSKK